MERSSRWLFAACLVLCGATLVHVGCGSGSRTSSASGVAPEADSAPPDIKKGVKIRFYTVADTRAENPRTVLEVRGKWLKLDFDGKAFWYNADNFSWYEVQ